MPEIPCNVIGDEYHTKLRGEKIYIATTIAEDCILGVKATKECNEAGLTEAYGVFKEEAIVQEPEYLPKSVNLDGWKAGSKAWQSLFKNIVIISCFLHGFIKIRDRALKSMNDIFMEISNKVWDYYKAENKKSFSQRIRRLREWAKNEVPDSVMKTNLIKLCNKNKEWQQYYDHPNSYRTSNMLDRLMRFMDRYSHKAQKFHGKEIESCTKTFRAFALIYNFTPSCPDNRRKNEFRSPVARLNNHEYHKNWLSNLLIAGSLNGYRQKPTKVL